MDLNEAKTYLGYVIAAVIAIIGYRQNKRQADVAEKKVEADEAGVVIGSWQQLYASVAAQVQALSQRVSALEKELIDSGQRHADFVNMLKKEHTNERIADAERHALERLADADTIRGLRDSIRQNSQSAAYLLGEIGSDMDKEVARAVAAQQETEG